MSKQQSALAVPEFLKNLNDGSKGNEGVQASDLSIPQLKVLQPLSPEVMNDKKTAGTIYNTMTRTCVETQRVINLTYVNEHSVWRKRHLGAGRMGSYSTAVEARKAVEYMEGSLDDYEIANTGIHKLLLLDKDNNVDGPAILYCSGTAKTFSDGWNTDIAVTLAAKNLPRYAGVWELSVITRKNSKGSWYALQQQFVDYVRSEEIFNDAAKQHEALAAPQQNLLETTS